MKVFKNCRSKLDEMQEQNLRKLESWGYWLTWGALLLSMMIQMLIYRQDAAKYLKGEWIVFMASNLFMVVAAYVWAYGAGGASPASRASCLSACWQDWSPGFSWRCTTTSATAICLPP